MAPHSTAPSSDVCEAPSVPQSQQQSVKSRKLKQKKHLKNSPAIKMCNTKVNNNKCEIERHNVSQSQVKDSQCHETDRVPPLPILTEDNLLAQAVESLNISPTYSTRQLQKRRNKNKQCMPAENKENLKNPQSIEVENKDSSNTHILCVSGNSESPSGQIENVCTPQLCGACGLQFQSVESLSQHLLRHIYEGMYAAQWLTQAMALVSQHQQETTTVEQPDMAFMSQPQEQYTTGLQQQQQPLSHSQLNLHQQQTSLTTHTQAPLPSPTLNNQTLYSQDTTFSHKIKSLKERKSSNKIIPVVETESTEAQSSPLIQQVLDSHELSNHNKISNHSPQSPQC